MYCFRENSNFPFSNKKIITLVVLLSLAVYDKVNPRHVPSCTAKSSCVWQSDWIPDIYLVVLLSLAVKLVTFCQVIKFMSKALPSVHSN